MQSIGQEALESRVLWDSTTEGLRTCKYLSHILTKPFLFSDHREKGNCVKRCQIQRKATRYAMSPLDYQETVFLIKGFHHNVHKPLSVHLQWSELQNCWHTESSRSLPATIHCRSSLIDPIRRVHRVMLAAY